MDIYFLTIIILIASAVILVLHSNVSARGKEKNGVTENKDDVKDRLDVDNFKILE